MMIRNLRNSLPPTCETTSSLETVGKPAWTFALGKNGICIKRSKKTWIKGVWEPLRTLTSDRLDLKLSVSMTTTQTTENGERHRDKPPMFHIVPQYRVPRDCLPSDDIGARDDLSPSIVIRSTAAAAASADFTYFCRTVCKQTPPFKTSPKKRSASPAAQSKPLARTSHPSCLFNVNCHCPLLCLSTTW